jgi:hypothetical protein
MAAAEQRHRAGVLQQALAQRWQVGSGDGLEAQVHHPATALPQARAQGIAPDLGRRSAEHRSRQQLAGLGDGIEFEASAPTVPTTVSANTAIQAPASRGTDPCVPSTVTSTPGSRARRVKKCAV